MNRLNRYMFAWILFFFYSFTCPAAEKALVHLGSIDLYTSNSMAVFPRGDAECIQFDGNRLYLQYMLNTIKPNVRAGFMKDSRTLWSGIRVFDLSNPTSPTTIAEIPNKYKFKVRDGRMLAQNPATHGLAYFDVSNPAAPKLLGHLPVRTDSFVLADHRAYFLARSSNLLRLEIWDLAIPTSPTLAGSMHKVPPATPALMNNFVILSDGGYRVENPYIEIIDASDAAQPKIISRLDGISVVDMHPAGSMLFAGGPRGGISILDLQNPRQPLKLGRINSNTADGGYLFRVSGSRLYACSPPVGIEIWDISNPKNPVLIEMIKDLPGIEGIDLAGDLLAVFQQDGRHSRVHLFRISHPK